MSFLISRMILVKTLKNGTHNFASANPKEISFFYFKKDKSKTRAIFAQMFY